MELVNHWDMIFNNLAIQKLFIGADLKLIYKALVNYLLNKALMHQNPLY